MQENQGQAAMEWSQPEPRRQSSCAVRAEPEKQKCLGPLEPSRARWIPGTLLNFGSALI